MTSKEGIQGKTITLSSKRVSNLIININGNQVYPDDTKPKYTQTFSLDGGELMTTHLNPRSNHNPASPSAYFTSIKGATFLLSSTRVTNLRLFGPDGVEYEIVAGNPSTAPKDSPEFKAWYDTLIESLPQCKPKDSAEFLAFLDSLPQCQPKDSAEFKAWYQKTMESTWWDPDFVYRMALAGHTWLKVHRIPDLDFTLLTLGYEYRTILFLLQTGTLSTFRGLALDERSPRANRGAILKAGIVDVPKVAYENQKGGMSHYSVDMVVPKMPGGMAELLGVPEWEGEAVFVETKCGDGSVARGEIPTDLRKWGACVKEGHKFLVFEWSKRGLLVLAHAGEGAATHMIVTAAFNWAQGKVDGGMSEASRLAIIELTGIKFHVFNQLLGKPLYDPTTIIQTHLTRTRF